MKKTKGCSIYLTRKEVIAIVDAFSQVADSFDGADDESHMSVDWDSHSSIQDKLRKLGQLRKI